MLGEMRATFEKSGEAAVLPSDPIDLRTALGLTPSHVFRAATGSDTPPVITTWTVGEKGTGQVSAPARRSVRRSAA